jgi:hypothetical protein
LPFPLSQAFLGYPLDKHFYPKLSMLVQMAKDEPWNFQSPNFKDSKNPYPILYNYLNFTYDRLLQENKIAVSSDDEAMCFNTGLQTNNEEDIFAYFIKNKRYPNETSKFKEPNKGQYVIIK